MITPWINGARYPRRPDRRVRAFGGMLLGLAMLLPSMHAAATPVPWRDTVVDYSAQGKPLRQVLKDLFTTQPFPLVIQGDVKGSVHGEFHKPAAEIFSDLEAAYGFVWYFDGTALYVSDSENLRSEIIPVAPRGAEQVAAMIERLGLREPRFPIRVSGGMAFVTGPQAYVELVVKALVVERGESEVRGPSGEVMSNGRGGVRSGFPDKRKLQIFQLKHAQAWDMQRSIGDRQYVVPGIASILRRLADDGTQAGDYAGSLDEADADADAEAQADRWRPRVRGVLGVADAAARNVSAGASSGGAHIEADVRTNSVIVRDSEENLRYYADIITKLDRPQKLVQLDVTIVDISSHAARELGVRLSANYPGAGGNQLTSSVGGSGFSFDGALGGASGRLRLQISALEQQGKAKVVSQPKILTLDNIEAVLSNEGTAYARVAGAYQTDLYPITAGLLMKITPQVIEGRKRTKVRLFVDIRDGKLDNRTGVDGLPVSTSNLISTQAVVGDGEIFLVGGHRRESSASQVSGVPGLSKVPVIGKLFRYKGNNNELAERLLMITPRVIQDDAEGDDQEQPGQDKPPATPAAPAAAEASRDVAVTADPPKASRQPVPDAAARSPSAVKEVATSRAAPRAAAVAINEPRLAPPAQRQAKVRAASTRPLSIWDGFEPGLR